MSNSIDSLLDGGIHRLAERRTGTTSGEARPRQASAEGAQSEDRVQLTDKASELRALSESLAASEEFDSSRVEALKQAIADGSYQVDAGRIAEKLLAIDKQLP